MCAQMGAEQINNVNPLTFELKHIHFECIQASLFPSKLC